MRNPRHAKFSSGQGLKVAQLDEKTAELVTLVLSGRVFLAFERREIGN